MPKNIKGGSGHKKQASKNYKQFNSKLRQSENKNEIYAMANSMLGNGRFKAICSDGYTRIVRIGGKFRGKNKSGNNVTINTLVLVGIRDYQSNDESCDLLEVYSEHHKTELLSIMTPKEKSVFITDKNEDDSGFIFSNKIVDQKNEYEKLIEPISNDNNNVIGYNLDDDYDYFDVDDL